jgi:hypothetical protein
MTGYSRRLPAILMPKPGTPEGNRFDVLAILKTNTGPSIRPIPWMPSGAYPSHGTLYNSFPWFVRFRTWPSGIDCSLRQKWPSISLKPGFRSQLWRSDELAKFEAQ